MFYRKNLPGWERAMRGIGGVAMIAYGLLAMPGTMAGYAVAAAGAVSICRAPSSPCPIIIAE